MAKIETTVQCGPGGWFVEWFRFSDEKITRWYGPRHECETRANHAPGGDYRPVWRPLTEGPPPYDAATATGMYDAW